MDREWQRYVDAATEVGSLTRKGAESVVRALVKQGEIAADRAERSIDDLLRRSERNRRVVTAMVMQETERAVARLGLASREEVDALTERVAVLEARVAELAADVDGPPSGEGRV